MHHDLQGPQGQERSARHSQRDQQAGEPLQDARPGTLCPAQPADAACRISREYLKGLRGQESPAQHAQVRSTGCSREGGKGGAQVDSQQDGQAECDVCPGHEHCSTCEQKQQWWQQPVAGRARGWCRRPLSNKAGSVQHAQIPCSAISESQTRWSNPVNFYKKYKNILARLHSAPVTHQERAAQRAGRCAWHPSLHPLAQPPVLSLLICAGCCQSCWGQWWPPRCRRRPRWRWRPCRAYCRLPPARPRLLPKHPAAPGWIERPAQSRSRHLLQRLVVAHSHPLHHLTLRGRLQTRAAATGHGGLLGGRASQPTCRRQPGGTVKDCACFTATSFTCTRSTDLDGLARNLGPAASFVWGVEERSIMPLEWKKVKWRRTSSPMCWVCCP